jgi:hypothetical protein
MCTFGLGLFFLKASAFSVLSLVLFPSLKNSTSNFSYLVLFLIPPLKCQFLWGALSFSLFSLPLSMILQCSSFHSVLMALKSVSPFLFFLVFYFQVSSRNLHLNALKIPVYHLTSPYILPNQFQLITTQSLLSSLLSWNILPLSCPWHHF